MSDDKLTGERVFIESQKQVNRQYDITYGRGYRAISFDAVQERTEFIPFIDDILKVLPDESQRKMCLEVGLDKGGTHLAWLMMFKHVISLDISEQAIVLFKSALKPGLPGKSSFICADSSLPGTRIAVCNTIKDPIDMLFIDGNHAYSAVEADYLNYEPLVRPGGVVAFHDTKTGKDVKRFVDELGAGTLPFSPGLIDLIRFETRIGLAYYIKK